MTKPENERLAVLETKMSILEERTESMDGKLDVLIADRNRQKGFVVAWGTFCTFLGGIVASGIAYFK